jgi:diguanylate cyclase (GGDEF)-like protein
MTQAVSTPVLPPAFPAKLVAIGVALMIGFVAISSLLTWRASDQIRTVLDSQVSVLTAAERVQHYGSILELSIKAVVATGDVEAAARYKSVQPQLRRTLNRLRGEIQLKPNKAAVARIDRADLMLTGMEYEALELASQGDLGQARKIIHSARYEHLLDIYFEGLKGIEERAADYLIATERKVDNYLWGVLALSFASFGLLLVGWFTILRPARSWGAKLNEAHQQAADAVKQLEESRGELEALNKKFFDQARIDPLTKLQTRLKFNEDAAILWPRVERYQERYCAVMCDIDRFKQYNDSYGHIEGDAVLKRVADALSSASRGGDQIYRFGGEEFVIILPYSTIEAGVLAGERYRIAVEALQIPHSGSHTGVVTVSMGVSALEDTRGRTVQTWLAEADAALYEAKRAGRNKVVRSQAVPAV